MAKTNKWEQNNSSKVNIRKNKIAQNIYCIIALSGFILMLGSVGALEQNVITFGRCIMQSAIGLLLFAVGAFIGDAIIGGEN